jgi:hypothetical protein
MFKLEFPVSQLVCHSDIQLIFGGKALRKHVSELLPARHEPVGIAVFCSARSELIEEEQIYRLFVYVPLGAVSILEDLHRCGV